MSNSQLYYEVKNLIVDRTILDKNPTWIFVFGDNTIRKGLGGAAKLRYHPQSYGFITKIKPTYDDKDFYRPEEYSKIYRQEIDKLVKEIIAKPKHTFLISMVGAGLANKYKIFDQVIEPNIKKDLNYSNVCFLW